MTVKLTLKAGSASSRRARKERRFMMDQQLLQDY